MDWLVQQLPALILGFVAIMTGLRNRDLQRRNDSLSDVLTQVVRTSSEERLSLTRKHADERERLRTECMLQLDAMQRTITTSFSQVLSQRLRDLRPPSQTGSGG
jgi:hypothetical protein